MALNRPKPKLLENARWPMTNGGIGQLFKVLQTDTESRVKFAKRLEELRVRR